MPISSISSGFTNFQASAALAGFQTNNSSAPSFESGAHIGSNWNILDYNAAVSSIQRGNKDLIDFQKIADEATDPAEKKRYQDAVKTQQEVLAKSQSDLASITSSLHLDSSITSSGKLMSWDGYEAYKANGYKSNASILSGLISMPASETPSFKDWYDKNEKPFHQTQNASSIDVQA